MSRILSRRLVIKQGLLVGAALPAFGFLVDSAAFADGTAVDPADPAAKALGYVTSSTTAGQNCANCTQYKGAAGAPKGACAIFPGKEVTAGGYCKAWVKKPAA